MEITPNPEAFRFVFIQKWFIINLKVYLKAELSNQDVQVTCI